MQANSHQASLHELQGIRELPIAPQNLVRVLQFIKRDCESLQDLAQIILRDQTLTLMLLKAANSAHFAAARPITTVSQAVILMGTKNVANIFNSLAKLDYLSKVNQESLFDLKTYWEFNLVSASLAKLIAEALHYPLPEEAYIGGLLHELGTLGLNEKWSERFSHVLIRGASGQDRLNEEKRIFGFTHQTAGVVMAKDWGIKDPLLKVIENHHRDGKSINQKSGCPLVDIVYIASVFAENVIKGNELPQELIQSAKLLTDLSKENLFEIRARFQSQHESIRQMLSIQNEDLLTYAQILEKTNTRLENVISVHERVHSEMSRKLVKVSLQRDALLSFLHARSRQEVVERLVGIGIQHFPLPDIAFYESDWDGHTLRACGPKHGIIPQGINLDLLQDKGILVKAALEKRPIRFHVTKSETIVEALGSKVAAELCGRELIAFPVLSSVLAGGVLIGIGHKDTLFSEEDFKNLWEICGEAALRMRGLQDFAPGGHKVPVSEKASEEVGQNYFREVNHVITETTYLVNDSLKTILRNLHNIQERMNTIHPHETVDIDPYALTIARRQINDEASLIDEQLTRISESLGKLRLFSEQIKSGQAFETGSS